ncbi:MAG: NHLP bacteriocin system secretion protein [Clostridiales Family XIII bacterium]|jgi:HlyD family secretion protein|nr:NHLP bacteriocin system secretion protein [Clostridiales Family XIII bacterium]
MAELFRKSSLEKLSSPEQLDRMIVITSPSFWIAMLGVLVIFLSALTWSIFGRLPMKVNSQGIFLGDEGLYPIVAIEDGVLTQIDAKIGDDVEKNQVIAQISNDAQAYEISTISDRIEAVRATSLDAVTDIPTADNRELIDIKTQITALHGNLSSLDASLVLKRGAQTKYASEVNRLAGIMDTSKNAYYNAIGGANQTATQMEYESAATELAKLQEAYSAATQQMAQAYEAIDPNDANTLVVYNNAVEMVDSINNQMSSAQTQYDNAKNAMIASGTRDSNIQKLMNEYTIAQTNYQNAYAQNTSAEAEIIGLEQQIAAEKVNIAAQEGTLTTQFNTAKDSIMSQLTSELDKYKISTKNKELKADHDGIVQSLNVKLGSIVTVGSEIAKIQSKSIDNNTVICYVALQDGKKIEPGMQVMISPTTANEQEYGHMNASVISVDSYITSSETMQNQLGNNILVESFIQNGPVVAVYCELQADDNTVSGYRWSNRKGNNIEITKGTLVTARIITEKKAPIEMIIPALKKFFTVNKEG